MAYGYSLSSFSTNGGIALHGPHHLTKNSMMAICFLISVNLVARSADVLDVYRNNSASMVVKLRQYG
jgi:hypothetical protein